MKTQTEIENMLKHTIKSDGAVSPSVVETLEWVLSLSSDEHCRALFNLNKEENHD